jgi:hypothetical protein
LGFDFTFEYKKGRENKAADALSRKEWPEEEQREQPEEDQHGQHAIGEEAILITQAISTMQPSWTRELNRNYAGDQQLQELIKQFQQGELDPVKYQFHQGLIFYKGRIHLGGLEEFQQQVLQYFHSHPLAGHMGAMKSYSRLKK